MPRKPNPTSSRYYFTNDTEEAIVKFNASVDDKERNILYDSQIRVPFHKMAENLIHRFKFYHFDIPYEDVKHETVAHLYEKITKYSKDKGKAFSYFSIVAKNYLINANNKNYEHAKNTDDLIVVDDNRTVINEVIRANKVEDDKEFMDLFVEFVEANLKSFTMEVLNKKSGKLVNINMFDSKTDCIVADSIMELFKRREHIEVFNKKALYILIKERSCIENTQDITKVLKRVETLYKDTFENWRTTGYLHTKYLKTYNYK